MPAGGKEGPYTMGSYVYISTTATTDNTNAVTVTMGTGDEVAGEINGRVCAIVYTADSNANAAYANSATFVVTTSATGQTLWSEASIAASKTVRPVAAGAYANGAASAVTEDWFFLANEHLEIAVSNAGDTKSGTFGLIFER